jgi:hypothetical protein
MCGNAACNKVNAATPRVMLADYSIAEGSVTAGKDFTLKLTLQNTAAKSSVRNLKVSVTSENGEFLPTEGAGTAYLDKIDAASEAELVYPMHAVDGLEEKSYKVAIKTEYEDASGNAYEVTDSIYLSITLEQRISITDIYLADYDLELGDTVEVCGTVNNLGAGKLYNVTAHIEGDNLIQQDSYIGNIESGKSGTIDALTKASAVSSMVGDENKLIVTYEDKAGNVYSEEIKLSISVSQPIYENLEKVKDTPNVSGVVKQIVVILIIAAVIACIIVLSYRRWKKKQTMLEDM